MIKNLEATFWNVAMGKKKWIEMNWNELEAESNETAFEVRMKKTCGHCGSVVVQPIPIKSHKIYSRGCKFEFLDWGIIQGTTSFSERTFSERWHPKLTLMSTIA